MPRQSDARVARGLFRPRTPTGPASAGRRAARASASGGSACRRPGSRPRRKRRRIAAAIARISSSPNRMPMQIRGPAAERHVGALRELRPLLRREALGPEGVRVIEDVGQPVAGPGGVVDRELRRDPVAAELELGVGSARADPRRRVEAERLLHHHVEVGHLGEELGGVRRLIPGNSVALVREALAPFRVAGELVEEEGEGRGGRVVAGEQQRQDLVANLLVGEAVSLRVLGLDQEPEDVLAGVALAAAAGISPRMIPSSVRRTRRSRENGLPGPRSTWSQYSRS